MESQLRSHGFTLVELIVTMVFTGRLMCADGCGLPPISAHQYALVSQGGIKVKNLLFPLAPDNAAFSDFPTGFAAAIAGDGK